MMSSSRVTSSKFILFILPTGIARFASYESDMDHFLIIKYITSNICINLFFCMENWVCYN